MNWRDFFYFSKGERRALIVLLCLITISWIWLLWSDKKQASPADTTNLQQPKTENRVIIGNNPLRRFRTTKNTCIHSPIHRIPKVIKDSSDISRETNQTNLFPPNRKISTRDIGRIKHGRDNHAEKSSGNRSCFCQSNREIPELIRRFLRCFPAAGGLWH